ncbi:Ig-like domain-containing protein [Mycolicibacterium vinylchloridicum]|uniref:Ig-like domain-containing protein n=1 Tax=Mycolicibacterium vinylchloridicum TaxID=2736928 RepID=UPI0015C9D934|nr:Ig-like domain-containing protein [Mycolicibacterium vinylchloridicum]
MDWAPLTWIRRTFFNRPPTVRYRASLNSQDMSNGVITGNIGALDPDRDRLSYTVIANPKYGSVAIDQLTGEFTFTPTELFAEFGGTDAFTVKVSDGRFHPLSVMFSPDRGTPTSRLPVAVAPLPGASPSSPLETFKVDKEIEFDVPDGVVVTGADLTPDGEHLLLEVKINGKTQIAVSNLDGGDYQCISCGVVTNAAKARVLEDNQRVWFASTSGQQSADDPLGGAGLISYSILECEGSISSCANPTVKNVEFPSDRGPMAATTQNRETKPDPFGEYVTWTENTPVTGPRMSIARLVATDTGYQLVDQRIFSPQWDEDTEYAQDFVNATRFYEGASWHGGGRYLKYQTTTTGLNYDIWLLDTLTGERRQLTTDLDYNESGDMSPDGRSIYFSSARGADRMDVFTALQRPSLLDVAAFPQMGRVSLWNNRRAMNEPWVMNLEDGQQLGGYSGQPIIMDPDWTIRGWSWFPDSTRALINEQQRPDTATPGAPETPWRFSIISFPTREATTPLAPVHQDPAAIAKWSVPVEEYNPMMGRQVPSRVLKGMHSGTATLQYSGAFASGSYSVTYDNYSDDGKTFINGTEKVTVVNPIGNATWTADLTSTGERTGYLKGSIKAGKANAFTGTVSSEINGVTYTGVPTQTDFPVINPPQLAVSSFDNRVRVTATVAEDGYPRPVHGATVTVGSLTTTTDEHGFAQIPFAPGDTITAIAGGFGSITQQVPSA